MTTKIFEVRDRATFIPVIAVKLDGVGTEDQEIRLLHRAGYGSYSHQATYVLLGTLDGGHGSFTSDAYTWLSNGTRTLHEAHKYIQEHFDGLRGGAVIDVEYILGETDICKTSDLDYYG